MTRINWKQNRKGNWNSGLLESGRDYSIVQKRSGKWFVEAYRVGGAQARLPWKEFETAEDAMAWVAELEQKETEARERREREAISF